MKMNLEYKTATQQFDMVEAHISHWCFHVPERRGGVLHLTNRSDDVPENVPGTDLYSEY